MIRTEEARDHDAVREILVRAFGRPDEADQIEKLRRDAMWLPEMSFVAEHDGAVVGHCVMVRMDVGGDEALAMSPVAVDPDHQRRGIGSALIRWALVTAETRQEPMVVAAGKPNYYSRFGFEAAHLHGVHGPFPEASEEFAVRRFTKEGGPSGFANYSDAFGIG